MADLKGKRVALDEPGSGTLINARIILAAYGVQGSDIKPEYIKPNQAGDKLQGRLARRVLLRRRRTGRRDRRAGLRRRRHRAGADRPAPQAEGLRKASPFFAPDTIPANTYKGVAAVKTLAVGAQWVTSAKADADTVYEITKALFSDATQKTLAAGHAKGKFDHQGERRPGRGHPVPPGRREVLQGSRADEVEPARHRRTRRAGAQPALVSFARQGTMHDR